jgi:hypothetical protein
MSHSGSSEFDQEEVMKRMALHVMAATGLMAATILAAVPATTTEAVAQQYPWCSQYNNGSNNCGFSTYAQCASNVSGIGGSCQMNAWYGAARGQAPALDSILARAPRSRR